MHRAFRAVGKQRVAAAEAARDAVRRPGAEARLAHGLEALDLEIAAPEAAFLLAEPRSDLLERGAVVARRQLAFVTRSGQAEVEVEDIRGAGGGNRNGEGRGERDKREHGAAEHNATPCTK